MQMVDEIPDKGGKLRLTWRFPQSELEENDAK